MTYMTTPNAEVYGFVMWIRRMWKTHTWISIYMWTRIYVLISHVD